MEHEFEQAIGALASVLREARPGCIRMPLEPYQAIYRIFKQGPQNSAWLCASNDFFYAIHLGLRQSDSERAVRKIAASLLKEAVTTKCAEVNGEPGLPVRWELFFALHDAFEEATPHLLMDSWNKIPPLFDALLPEALAQSVRRDGMAALTATRLKMQHKGCNQDIASANSSDDASGSTSLLSSLVSPSHLPNPLQAQYLSTSSSSADGTDAGGQGFIPFEWLSVVLERIFTHDNITVRRSLLHRFLLGDISYDNGTKSHFLDASAMGTNELASKEDKAEEEAVAAVIGKQQAKDDEDIVEGGHKKNNEIKQPSCPFALRLPCWWVCGEQHLLRVVSEASMFKGAEDQLGRALQRYIRVYSAALADACWRPAAAESDETAVAQLPIVFARNVILSLPAAIDGKTSTRRFVKGLLQAASAPSSAFARPPAPSATELPPLLVPPVLTALRLTINAFSQKQHRGATSLLQKEALALVFSLLPLSHSGLSLNSVAFMISNVPASIVMPGSLVSFLSSASTAAAIVPWVSGADGKGEDGEEGAKRSDFASSLSLHGTVTSWLLSGSDAAVQARLAELQSGIAQYLTNENDAASAPVATWAATSHHQLPWTAVSLARLIVLFPWATVSGASLEIALAPLTQALASIGSDDTSSLPPHMARALLLLNALLSSLRCEDKSSDAHLSCNFSGGSWAGPLAPMLQQSLNDPPHATGVHDAKLGPVAVDDSLPPVVAAASASLSSGSARLTGRKMASSNDSRVAPVGSEFLHASSRDIESYCRTKALSSSARGVDPVRLKTLRDLADECGPLAAPPLEDPYLDDDADDENDDNHVVGDGRGGANALSPSALPEGDPSLARPYPLTPLAPGTSSGVPADLDDPDNAGDFAGGNFYTAVIRRRTMGPEAADQWTARFVAENVASGPRSWDPHFNTGGVLASTAVTTAGAAVRDDIATVSDELVQAAADCGASSKSAAESAADVHVLRDTVARLLFAGAASSPAAAVIGRIRGIVDGFAKKLGGPEGDASFGSFTFDHQLTTAGLSSSQLSPVPLFSFHFYLETMRLLVEASSSFRDSSDFATTTVSSLVAAAMARLQEASVATHGGSVDASKAAHARLLTQAHALQVLGLSLSLHPTSTTTGLFSGTAGVSWQEQMAAEASELRRCIELILSQAAFRKPSGAADLALPFAWSNDGSSSNAETSTVSWPHFRAFYESCKWLCLSRALYRLALITSSPLYNPTVLSASAEPVSALCGLKAGTADSLAESALDALDSASAESRPAVIGVLAMVMRYAVARDEDREFDGASASGEETLDEVVGGPSDAGLKPITSVSVEGCAKALVSLFFSENRFNRPLVQAISRCFLQPYLFIRRPGLHASVEMRRRLAIARGDATVPASTTAKPRVPVLRRIIAIFVEGMAHDGRYGVSLQLFTARLINSWGLLLNYATAHDLRRLSGPVDDVKAARATAASAVLIAYSPVMLALAMHREPLHDFEEPMAAEEPSKRLLAEWYAAVNSHDPQVRREAYRIAMIGKKNADDENNGGLADKLEDGETDMLAGGRYWNSLSPSAVTEDARPEVQEEVKKRLAQQFAAAASTSGAAPFSTSSLTSSSFLALRGMGALTRVQALCFFETVCNHAAHLRWAALSTKPSDSGVPIGNSAALALHRILLLRLLLFTTNKKWSYDWIPGNPVHCAKLRMWQALTLLMSRWGHAKRTEGLPVPSGAAAATANAIPVSASSYYLPAEDMFLSVPPFADGASNDEDDEEEEEEEEIEGLDESSPFPLATLQTVDPFVMNALSMMEPSLLQKLFARGRVWARVSPQRALEVAVEASPKLKAKVAAAEKLAAGTQPAGAASTTDSSNAAALTTKAAKKEKAKAKKAAKEMNNKSAPAVSRSANLSARAAADERPSFEVSSSYGSVSRAIPKMADPGDDSTGAPDTVSMRRMIDSVTEEDEVEVDDTASAGGDEDALLGETGVALRLVQQYCTNSSGASEGNAVSDDDHTIASLCINIIAATSMLPGQHSSTRHYVDTSMSAVARRFPQLLARSLVKPALRETNMQQSFSISIGAITTTMMQALTTSQFDDGPIHRARLSLARSLFRNAMPWLVSNNGVMRALVQTCLIDSAPMLFPELFDQATGRPLSKLLPLSSASAEAKALARKQRKTSWLLPTLRMLAGSADLQAMHARQRKNASAIAGPSSTVSLLRLLCETHGNEHGELLPYEPMKQFQQTFAFVSSLQHAVAEHSGKDEDILGDFDLWTSSAGLLPSRQILKDSRLKYGLIKRSRALAAAAEATSAASAGAVALSAPDATSAVVAESEVGASEAAPAIADIDNVREKHYESASLPVLNNYTRTNTTGASKKARTPAAVVNMQRKIGSALEESYGGVAGGATGGGAGAAPSTEEPLSTSIVPASAGAGEDGAEEEQSREARRAAIISELQRKAGVHPLLTHQAPGVGGGSRKCQPVIVCASLLSKATNLGGLARTSEIFGLESLLVPDLKVTEETSFKEVSVSAGEWMTMGEVPPSKLVPFLRLKRAEGYTICGLEQAARSKPLGSFSFPRKLVIVLGAELMGMPVEVLQELDLVVEIPQLGLIRSLNVHVSASLLIWEYCRQQLAGLSSGAGNLLTN